MKALRVLLVASVACRAPQSPTLQPRACSYWLWPPLAQWTAEQHRLNQPTAGCSFATAPCCPFVYDGSDTAKNSEGDG